MKRTNTLTFTFCATLLFFAAAEAQAACVPGRPPVCGDQRICVSNRRPSGMNDPNDKLPGTVCQALKSMANKFGRVEVMSAFRNPKANAARGGAKGSFHTKFRAADVHVPAASQSTVNNFMKSIKTGGLRHNVYCTGTVHVDNSGGRDNYSSCVGGRRPKNYSRKPKYPPRPKIFYR